MLRDQQSIHGLHHNRSKPVAPKKCKVNLNQIVARFGGGNMAIAFVLWAVMFAL